MQIKNLNAKIQNIHGQEYLNDEAGIRYLLVEALGNVKGSGSDRINAFDLGMRIKKNEPDIMELTAEDNKVLDIAIEQSEFNATVYAQLKKCVGESPVVEPVVG